MRKSTLFISAALTTFMLAVLFGVASAYRNIVNSTQEVAAQPQPTAMVQMVSEPIPAQVVNITPEEAAAIASKVLNRTDLYSVEGVQLEGVDSYLVTFSSGDIVYISLDGQVLSISKIVVTVVTQPGNHGGGEEDEGGGGAGGGGGGGGEDESHDEGGEGGGDD